jgi:hypothetical protein
VLLEDVKKEAKRKGIEPKKLNKTALVRAIQRAEGNFDCFGSALDGHCDQESCLWREDCFAAAKRQQAA